MALFTAIKLRGFTSGLHLSRGQTEALEQGQSRLHSDTLKSAIFVNALQLYGSSIAKNKDFLKSFSISSAFPYYYSETEKKEFYFFPKPALTKLPFYMPDEGTNERKLLKKITYIDKDLFCRVLKGEKCIELSRKNFGGTSFVSDIAIKTGITKIVKGKKREYIKYLKTILEDDDCEKIMASKTYQHVSIPRFNQADSTPFYVDKMFFHKNAGLFFLIEFHKGGEELKKQVFSSLKLLSDNGVGMDRTMGRGQFDFKYERDVTEIELDLPKVDDLPEKERYQMSLSLYCPRKEEVVNCIDRSFYGLTKRGGYISNPKNPTNMTIRKRSIYMFTEGSLFPQDVDRTGKIANLKPDFEGLNHAIWRDGRALFLPIHVKNTEK